MSSEQCGGLLVWRGFVTAPDPWLPPPTPQASRWAPPTPRRRRGRPPTRATRCPRRSAWPRPRRAPTSSLPGPEHPCRRRARLRGASSSPDTDGAKALAVLSPRSCPGSARPASAARHRGPSSSPSSRRSPSAPGRCSPTIAPPWSTGGPARGCSARCSSLGCCGRCCARSPPAMPPAGWPRGSGRRAGRVGVASVVMVAALLPGFAGAWAAIHQDTVLGQVFVGSGEATVAVPSRSPTSASRPRWPLRRRPPRHGRRRVRAPGARRRLPPRRPPPRRRRRPPPRHPGAPAGRWTIALLGGDAGPHRWNLRTDTMIVVSIDRQTGDLASVSVPRNG